jgi:hypothetical protein
MLSSIKLNFNHPIKELILGLTVAYKRKYNNFELLEWSLFDSIDPKLYEGAFLYKDTYEDTFLYLLYKRFNLH